MAEAATASAASASASASAAAVPLERAEATCRAAHARFLLPRERVYTHQYSHVYLKRLMALRKVVEAQARRQWGGGVRIAERVISLSPASAACVVVGTLYKVQPRKPDVLEAFAAEFDGEAATTQTGNLCSEADQLVLEDESGRMDLRGLNADLVQTLATGLVVGMRGKLAESGEFVVSEFVFPGMPPQQPRLLQQPSLDQAEAGQAQGGGRKLLLLASGLCVGDAGDPLRLQLLVDYCLGHLGGEQDRACEAEIVRVILAGGSVSSSEQQLQLQQQQRKDVGKRSSSKAVHAMAAPIQQLDYSLAELATSVPVDLMPGAADPCSVTLPQQPLHGCLFPHCSRFETFRRVSNPYECVLEDDLLVLGASGQPVQDLLRHTQGLSELDLLQSTLVWRHMAPTAPDSLPCYPLTQTDPYVLTSLPHLYFSGAAAAFGTRLVEGEDGARCRIVTVPSFRDTGTVVLVDLASPTLECTTIRFEGLVPPTRAQEAA